MAVNAQLQKLYEFVRSEFAEKLDITETTKIKCHSNSVKQAVDK